MSHPPQPRLTPEEIQRVRETSDLLGKTLNETTTGATIRLRKITFALGVDQALALLEEVKALDASGGVLTNDQSRQRTIGGIYFYFARQRLKDHPDFYRIFFTTKTRAMMTPTPRTEAPPDKPPRSAPLSEPFIWSQRQDTITTVLQTAGRSTSMKITLMGRPGKIVDKGAFIVTAMPTMKVPALPKGVPLPEEATQTQILVYIAQKQWKKVVEAIQDPEDALIVDGFAIYEPQIKGIAVLASNVTTKAIQRAKPTKTDPPSTEGA